ncbi:MAG: hypothetical protein SPI34_07625 [Opitutales bacterium]|nr:hypothetical protein [Opitutales bacterium]
MKKYKVYWKGRIVGEYGRAEILAALNYGKLGMLHSVDLGNGEIVPMQSFLDLQQVADSKPQTSPAAVLAAYFLSGLCFLGWQFLAVFAPYCYWIFRKGQKKSAAYTLTLALAFLLLGTLFFSIMDKLG